MGNNLVPEIIDKMKDYNDEATVAKIWNKGKLSIILACKNPSEWRTASDPFYAYNGDKIDGITVTDNMKVFNEVCKPENLIYSKVDK